MKQNLLVLIILVAVAAFLAGFWTREQVGQKKTSVPGGTTNGTGQITPAPQSPLAVENLKQYASQLGLNSPKFNQCLDSGEKNSKIKEDITQADSLGVGGTPAFFINGRFLGGNFPFEDFKEIIDKELRGEGSDNLKDYSTRLQEVGKSQGGQPAPFNPKAVKVGISKDDPQSGPADAKVTIVEFSDFQCPFCVRVFSTVKKIEQTYGDKIRLVFKNYPLDTNCNSSLGRQLHPFACKAAEAALCALDQGKFWEYHDKLFESQPQ